MSSEITEQQKSLLMRLSYLAVRTYQSRVRHYSSATSLKHRHVILNTILIVCSTITTAGVFSILTGETVKALLKNDILFVQVSIITQLVSALFAAATTALSLTLAALQLEQRTAKHEQSGHDYTSLRDDVLALAHRVRFNYRADMENRVLEAEQRCNALGYSSPMIPPQIHNSLVKEEVKRRVIEPRYWLKRFIDPGSFVNDFLVGNETINSGAQQPPAKAQLPNVETTPPDQNVA